MNDVNPSPETAAKVRPRRGIVTVLLVLAALTGVLASLAVWSGRQLLETDQWADTSSELLESEAIRAAVGTFMVDALFANVDVQGQIEGALPPRIKPLAGPAAGGLRQLATNNAPKLLERPRVQALWEQINRAAHERFLAVANGEADSLTVEGDEVYLDLGVLVGQLGTDLGIGAADKIPAGVAQLDVMGADDLELVQDAVTLLEDLAYGLTALTFLLLGLAVYLARGWRREAVRAAGWVFIAIGAIVLVARSAAGAYVVDALAPTAAAQPAAEDAWSIATSLLEGLAVAMIGYGIAIVIGAWLAAPGAIASAVRRSITPFIRDRRTLYPILLAIVLLVYAWSPTEGTRRLIPSLILIALLVIGAEALRRQSIAEFPTATMDGWSRAWRERVESVRSRAGAQIAARRERRTGAAASAAPAPADRIGQLERLADLHRAGVLSDAELEEEKALIRG